MRLCNYRPVGSTGPLEGGFVLGSRVMPLATSLGPGPLGPTRLRDALDPKARTRFGMGRALALARVELGPPLCPVLSLSAFEAFEDHVRGARGRPGLQVAPAFSLVDPATMLGPGDPLVAPAAGARLDFALAVGCVIGRGGRDIPLEQAEAHVAGYTVLNDWSLRDPRPAQMAPGAGRDLPTSIGPVLVTPDELEDRRSGKGFDLEMVARVNGRELTRGNWNSIHLGFAEMITRASQGAFLRSGDLLSSGAVGAGCILELGPENTGGWLGAGDVVELEVERLGLLSTTVVAPVADATSKKRR